MSDLSQSTVEEALQFSIHLLSEMGELIRTRREQGFSVHTKTGGSIVTDVDLAVEREARRRIRNRWPGHLIEGEEEGRDSGASDFRWLVDPIDGTQSFRHGVPLYGTILALTWKERPIVGVINLPGLRQCYWAGQGLGAYRDGERIHIADVGSEEVMDQIVAMGDRQQFERAGLSSGFDAILKRHRWARTYTDCFGHCLAVEGAVGAMVDPAVHPWDVAATEVLIGEAGGVFERLSASVPGRLNVVFGKPTVVEWVLGQLDGATDLASTDNG